MVLLVQAGVETFQSPTPWSPYQGQAWSNAQQLEPTGPVAQVQQGQRLLLAVQHPTQVEQEQHHVGLPEDDSLVLYKDPSGLTVQESMGSVVSGRLHQGDTFFTALRRSYSFVSDEGPELAPEAQATACSLPCMDSQINPMCSPSSLACFGACEDSAYYSAAGGLQEEYSKAETMATCESSTNTLYQGVSTAPAGQGLVPTASVMDVISSLYCSSAATGPNTSQQQTPAKWHQPDKDGMPLVAHAAAVQLAASTAIHSAAACTSSEQQAAEQPHTEQPFVSSVGSCDPLPELKNAGCVSNGTTGARKPDAHTDELQHQNISLSSVASAASVNSASYTWQRDEQMANDAEAGQQQLDTLDNQQGIAEQHQLPQAGLGVESMQQQQEQDAAAAYLEQVQGLIDKRAQVQAELSGYVTGLTAKLDEDGQQLVLLPKDYQLMVERMLCQHRPGSHALKGWEGPHRYEELPIAQLPVSHDDPQVAAGLEVIRQLDDKLKESWIEAQVAARGVAPEQWAAAERQRLEARAARLEEGLAKERQKRLHAARLLRALKKLDEQQVEDLLLPGANGLSGYSYYKLQPQEEQLLAAVLGRDEAELELHNPFDALTVCLVDDASTDVQSSLYSSTPASQQLSTQYSILSNSAADVAPPVTMAAGAPAMAQTAAAVAGQGEQHQAAGGTSPLTAAPGAPGIMSQVGSLGNGQCSCYSMHSAASGSKPRRTLAEIDELLKALQAGYTVVYDTSLASTRPSSNTLSSTGSRRVSHHSAAPQVSEKRSAGALHDASKSNASICGSQIVDEHKRDFVRDQREAKELMQRERDIDRKLREIRTSELPAKLAPEQLQALLQQCIQSQQATAACG